ncbi:MAG TPA: tripartite tricarboxylate transporter substrate binding protein [Burkholderiales bacterium]|nr:tripartite tricarboxylate transporter substrate binding protein [Burkholderiales bacterium]
MQRLAGVAAMVVLAATIASARGAAPFPAKPVRIVVPFGPGGTSDVVTRIVSPTLSELWGQQLVVDNRPGAGGNIGSELVARAPADGYTLVMATVATHGIGPSLYTKLPFHPIKDFAPISLLASTPSVVIVNPSVPVSSVRELIALARSKPGLLLFGSAGNGGSLHLSGELLNSMTGVKLLHVPYKGAAAALIDLMSGQIQIMFDTLPSAIPHIKSRKVKALAVTSASRIQALPDVPTVSESGVPGYEVTSWYGPLAPAATPRSIVQKLEADFVRTANAPEVQQRLTAAGADPIGSTAETFAAFIETELKKWGKVVRESGARID